MAKQIVGITMLVALGLGLVSWPASAERQAPISAGPQVQGPFVGAPVNPISSPQVRHLPDLVPDRSSQPFFEINPRQRGEHLQKDGGGENSATAPASRTASASNYVRTPAPALNFDGMSAVSVGASWTPPDPIGDVGPNHYVQMVNSHFAVYDKSGVLLDGPHQINQLWSGAGNSCETDNDGDPVVLYDPLADRWLLSQFAVNSGPPYFECIAISETPDPTGKFHLYAFDLGNSFPDYPKLGVWPDAYYMATNEGSPPVGVYAFDRANMLAGNAASFQKFQASRNFMLPSDLDGPTSPAAGAPNYFYTMMDDSYWPGLGYPGLDRLEIWEFRVDFVTPANSTFTHAQDLPLSFNYLMCGFFVLDCIPQLGTAQKLDSLSEWPMWRLQYRNFGSHETLVGNFTVDVNGDDSLAGLRWFELRRNGGSWSVYQHGTHAPDSDHRWVGSIAMDGAGNIALGYSVSSNSMYPALRYAARNRGDAWGTLQSEQTLIAGSASQTGSNRWGDYSSMNVDPADDCTFWYTGEYAGGGTNWKTRIGAFKLATCGAPDFYLSVAPKALSICASQQAVYTTTIGSRNDFTDPVTLAVTGHPSGTSGAFSTNPVTPADPPASSTLTISGTSGATAGSYGIEISGLTTTSTHSSTVSLDVFDTFPQRPIPDTPANGTADVSITPVFSWTAVAQASSYLLEVATEVDFNDVVYMATVAGTNHTVVSPLDHSTRYYWRVTAQNPCGSGDASAVFLFSTESTPVEICSAPDVAIPDNAPAGISDTLVIASGSAIVDLNVAVSATHTWVGDLVFTLEHVDSGTSVTIIDRPGYPDSTFGCYGNDIDVILDDEASLSVENDCTSDADPAPAYISGEAYQPNHPLSGFDGEDVSGEWVLTASDLQSSDTGALRRWCLISTERSPTATIDLKKTVGTNLGECAQNKSITVLRGTEVAYCYRVENTGIVTLTLHDLVDSELGLIRDDFALDLGPGDLAWVTATATLSETTINTATWTAFGNGHTVVATDTATVVVVSSNSPPTISDITDRSTEMNHPVGPIAFTVGDVETPVADLTLSGSSLNTALVLPVNIGFGGGGATRTLTITPTENVTGTVKIIVSVDDGILSTSDDFMLTVVEPAPKFIYLPLLLKHAALRAPDRF